MVIKNLLYLYDAINDKITRNTSVNFVAPCFITFHVMFCPDLETAFKKQHECSKSPTRVARMSPPPRSSMHGKHNIGQTLWRRMNIEEKKEEKHVESGTGGCSGLFRLHFTIPRLSNIPRLPNTPCLQNICSISNF